MKIEIGKKEARIIVCQLEIAWSSILHYESEKRKGEFTFDTFEKFNIDDFDLEETNMEESEFKTCIGLLHKCKGILKEKEKKQ